KHSPHEIAKTAALRVSTPKVAADKAQREFLGQILGGVRVAQGAAEVAVDRQPVALYQLLLGGGDHIGRAAVSLANDRPECRNAVEGLIPLVCAHVLRSYRRDAEVEEALTYHQGVWKKPAGALEYPQKQAQSLAPPEKPGPNNAFEASTTSGWVRGGWTS